MIASNKVQTLVQLGRLELDMYLWAKGFEEITQHRLDHLLCTFQKTITLANDDIRDKLQNMVHQLESVQRALLRSESVDCHLAQKILDDIHGIRHARISVLEAIEVEGVVGAHIIHFKHSLSTVGQVIRFRPASRDKRAFGFIGEVIILPADEQKAMKNLFQEIYLTRNESPFFHDLYYWPTDLPPQTFLEPRGAKDLLTIQWARHQEMGEDENEEWEDEVANIPEAMAIVKTIRKGDGDKRTGMRVFSIVEEMGGHLDSIEVYDDGFERWIAIGADGRKMVDDSDLFWLEMNEYRQSD